MTQNTQIQTKTAAVDGHATSQPLDSDFNKLLSKQKSLELSSFDHETYNQLFRLAEVMASTGVVPDSLRFEGNKANRKELPRERVVANCFLVAEQAHRWEISPFTILGQAAIVYGRLGWEGKTINALIQKFSGVYLKFKYNDKSGDDLDVTVSGTLPGEDEPRTVLGTVRSWKTTGDGSPWKMSDDIALKRQLSYRGAREWMRIHLPSVMLGVLTIDEIQGFRSNKPVASEVLPVKKPKVVPFSGKPEDLPNPEPELVDEEALKKIEQAWNALGKTDDDFKAAVKFLGEPPEVDSLMNLSRKGGERLLKILQKQMNERAGKTKGEIEKEEAAKKAAKPEGELNLEGG